MDFLEQIKDLESKGVTIDFSNEWYEQGINCNWSITFHNHLRPEKPGDKDDPFSKRSRQQKTGWYGDNHEFGDPYQSMQAAVKLAYFFLEDVRRIEAYFHPDGLALEGYEKEQEETHNFIWKKLKVKTEH